MSTSQTTTLEDVVNYLHDHIGDPAKRQAIAVARERDPLVAEWFQILTNPDAITEKPDLEPTPEAWEFLRSLTRAACGTTEPHTEETDGVDIEDWKLIGDGLVLHSELHELGAEDDGEPVLIPAVPESVLQRMGIATVHSHRALGAASDSRLAPIPDPDKWPTVIFHDNAMQIYETPERLPFQVALVCVFENGADGRIVLGEKLVSFRKGQKNGRPYLYAEIPLSKIVTRRDRPKVKSQSVWIIPADPGNEATRDWIRGRDLQQLRDDPRVAIDPELHQKVAELVRCFA